MASWHLRPPPVEETGPLCRGGGGTGCSGTGAGPPGAPPMLTGLVAAAELPPKPPGWENWQSTRWLVPCGVKAHSLGEGAVGGGGGEPQIWRGGGGDRQTRPRLEREADGSGRAGGGGLELFLCWGGAGRALPSPPGRTPPCRGPSPWAWDRAQSSPRPQTARSCSAARRPCGPARWGSRARGPAGREAGVGKGRGGEGRGGPASGELGKERLPPEAGCRMCSPRGAVGGPSA